MARWRPHWLARCSGPDELPQAMEICLADALALWGRREGADAIAELEICRERRGADPVLDLALAQFYLVAGQGEPDLLPREGPAADVGDWERNRVRLLGRARRLLEGAARARPDDAAVDFLLADVVRAEGRAARADSIVWGALGKCSRKRSVELLRQVQALNRYPARPTAGIAPEYPEAAVRAGVAGDVVLDVLVDPAGQAAQAVEVSSPHAALTRATARAVRDVVFEPARVGKYPVWSWLRVVTSFSLE
ncbi:MAG: TonB family protein [Candidatus Krumholzibacteriia bacterium]